MHKRGFCCRPVSDTSVRLSVCHFVYCIQTAEDIVKLLSRPGSPVTVVFFDPGADTHFQGNHSAGGAKYKGGGKIL